MMQHDIKVYEIDGLFYELASYESPQTKILHIVNRHRESLENFNDVNLELQSIQIDQITYQIYVYSKSESVSSWKTFLPGEITENEDFNIQGPSFVLFAIIEDRIFAIIGGSAIVVITRYLNQNFGIDLYEKIADPINDVITWIESRGITGNLSYQATRYRNQQKLIDAISFTRIPFRINLILRRDLIDTVFDFLEISETDNVHISIGSSFHLKWRISFSETHTLLNRLHYIMDSTDEISLSQFSRVKDKKLIGDHLRLQLYSEVRDDMIRIFSPENNPFGTRLDLDFAHPSKLEAFYECNNYKMYERGAQLPFYESDTRDGLYIEGLKFLFENADPQNPQDFNHIISGIRVYGYKDLDRKTHAMFADHLTCEINFDGRPAFLIDTRWYRVRRDFIETINSQCSSMITSNYWNNNPLEHLWGNQDEGDYNLQYNDTEGFLVLDKMLGQNIELCDLMYEAENTIYLIHVKKGFDAKIRDLANQISISSTRLNNDIKSGSFEFVDMVIERYNNANPDRVLSIEEFRAKFKKEIVYVMAFNSQLSNNRKVVGNMASVRSNIAKFSLIQSIREMQTDSYSLKIVEIENNSF